jgi:hypothetical protein
MNRSRTTTHSMKKAPDPQMDRGRALLFFLVLLRERPLHGGWGLGSRAPSQHAQRPMLRSVSSSTVAMVDAVKYLLRGRNAVLFCPENATPSKGAARRMIARGLGWGGEFGPSEGRRVSARGRGGAEARTRGKWASRQGGPSRQLTRARDVFSTAPSAEGLVQALQSARAPPRWRRRMFSIAVAGQRWPDVG